MDDMARLKDQVHQMRQQDPDLRVIDWNNGDITLTHSAGSTANRADFVCENRVLSKTSYHPVMVMLRGVANHLEGVTLCQLQADTAVSGRVHLTWEEIDELVKIRNWHGPKEEIKGEDDQ